VLFVFMYRLLTNRYLIVQPPRGQDVEWGYCFDIHLNAFFPLLMILHFFQLPLLCEFKYIDVKMPLRDFEVHVANHNKAVGFLQNILFLCCAIYSLLSPSKVL
jgi:UNC-50 family